MKKPIEIASLACVLGTIYAVAVAGEGGAEAAVVRSARLATSALAHAAPAALVPVIRSAQTRAPTAARQIEVLVLQGSDGPGGIAAGLSHIPQLRRPPFSAYTQITLESTNMLPLAASAASVALPNGNSVAVSSPGVLANLRFSVTVRLTRSGRTHDIHFAASPGDPFFTALSTGANTALILGFIIH